MSDDEEVIDLAGSDDEAALREEDQHSLRNFGLPVSQQQPDDDFRYIQARASPASDADALYAQYLQRKEIERAEEEEKATTARHTSFASTGAASTGGPLQSVLISEHHSQLASTGPFVDVHSLFLLYSSLFFHDSLASVSVRWTSKMTLCAGQCRFDARGGACDIALSEPLLKYRSKQEVIETLLHEMIHAYLFVGDPTQRDHDAHGENFRSHMRRINDTLGTKISVYHTFHAEVRQYKNHVWQCQGKCKDWKPYFGKVSRATNRPPGLYDRWFAQHQHNCGGYFIKTQGPTAEEIKEARKAREKKKRAEKRKEQDRAEERKENARSGVRQTSLRGVVTVTKTKTKRKSRASKDDEEGEKKEGEEKDEREERPGDGHLWDVGADDEMPQAKGAAKPRKRRKKLPGTGHVLGTGEEVIGGGRRSGKAVATPPPTEADDGSADDAFGSSQPSSSLSLSPPSPDRCASTSASSLPVSPASPSTPSTASSSASRPSVASSVLPAPSLAHAPPAAATASPAARRRTTNVFDLMAARGERRKVDQLIRTVAKQPTAEPVKPASSSKKPRRSLL